MKVITVGCLLFFIFQFCQAQNQGRVISKVIKPKINLTNRYIYKPPKNLLMPDTIEALIVYQNNGVYYKKYIPTIKIGNDYQFEFKAPDSTAVLIIGMVESKKNIADYNGSLAAKKKIVDNNKNAGFIFYLYNKNGNRFPAEKLQLADLLQNYAYSKLDLKVQNSSLIKLYEDIFNLYPKLKKSDNYLDYLTVLYQVKGGSVKPQLITYANQLANIKGNEAKWRNAVRVYQLLKMDEEQSKLEKRILSIYPNGELANSLFWIDFYSFYKKEEDTELSILSKMKDYFNKFNDSSTYVKDQFYTKIVSLLFDKKEWASFPKYEQLFGNKFIVANIYNRIAWQLSGEDIDSLGSDLEIAKLLSKKAIDYSEEYIKNLLPQYEYKDELRADHNRYLNTYALILYKLGHYDSAFFYQNIVYMQENTLNAGVLERYAVYAEKIKGVNYVKQVIEQQMLRGVNSPVILKQLQSIYKRLNLPEDEFNKLQDKSNFLSKQKKTEKIIQKLGSDKARNFKLKDLYGKEVSLVSLRNKVVVLDFWATWCVPCRASFPAMQEVVNKYKDDKDVVFLFIDVWENKSFTKMQEAAAKLIKDNNYSFNVLFDVSEKVVKDYKVEGIPIKFVIDKKGSIVFIGSTSNIEVEIENAKN